jgi:hypothetical protein
MAKIARIVRHRGWSELEDEDEDKKNKHKLKQ